MRGVAAMSAYERIACVICSTAQFVSSCNPSVPLQYSTSFIHSCRGWLLSCAPTP